MNRKIKISLMGVIASLSLQVQADTLCILMDGQGICFDGILSQELMQPYNEPPPYGLAEAAEIELSPSKMDSAFINIKKYGPSFRLSLNGEATDLVFSRWTPFREVNLAKSGPFTNASEGNVTKLDHEILKNLDSEGQNIVAAHDQFRVKHVALAWDHVEKDSSFGAETYAIPFYATFMFYKSNNLPAWTKSWAEIEQGSQALLGTLIVQVRPEKGAILQVEFYDETNVMEEVGQKITEWLNTKAKAIQQDQDRILKAAAPALEMQLNLQIEQLIKDLKLAAPLALKNGKRTLL